MGRVGGRPGDPHRHELGKVVSARSRSNLADGDGRRVPSGPLCGRSYVAQGRVGDPVRVETDSCCIGGVEPLDDGFRCQGPSASRARLDAGPLFNVVLVRIVMASQRKLVLGLISAAIILVVEIL